MLCVLSRTGPSYTIDVLLTAAAYGMRHFRSKLWHALFAAIVVISWINWIVYYPAHILVFRVARCLRPVLFVAKSPPLRRTISTCTPQTHAHQHDLTYTSPASG